MKRVVVAYSGDLISSAAIAWVAEKHRAEIVTVTAHLGQGPDLHGVRDRALGIGAIRAHVLDVAAEFANEVLVPALAAGALGGPRAALGPALSRPLLAKHLVHIARMEGAAAVAHGGTAAGPLSGSIRALDAALPLVLPAHEWDRTRMDVIAFARKRGIPVSDAEARPYTVETSVWGRAIAGDGPDDLWSEVPEDLYALTRSPADAPDQPASVEIRFDAGMPAAINDVPMPIVDLLASLQSIAGVHGVGRIDPSWLGPYSGTRTLAEAPAIVVLDAARAALQALVAPDDLNRLAGDLGAKYAGLVNGGRWHSRTRDALQAFAGAIQETLTGVVRLRLFKGQCHVVGRQSPFAPSGGERIAGPVAIGRE